MKRITLNTKLNDYLNWPTQPSILSLGQNEVHVWATSLDLPKDVAKRLKAYLSVDELLKASSYRFHNDRNRFIVAHGVLRKILSRYLLIGPDKIRFKQNNFGKPLLRNEVRGKQLKFNISHSRNVALYAITLERDVGIDIEHVRPIFNINLVSKESFFEEETEKVNELTQLEKQERFFTVWVLKEALAKAKGEGVFKRTKSDLTKASPWTLLTVKPKAKYLAALAIEGGKPSVKYLRWLESL